MYLEAKRPNPAGAIGVGDVAAADLLPLATVAVVSNPKSERNKAHLGRVREFCAAQPHVAHFEIADPADLDGVLDAIAASPVHVLVVNGGDGTVQRVLNRIYGEGAPRRRLPPIAVVPSGRTNIIAKDLGATGDPIATLRQILELGGDGVGRRLVKRQLISLDTGDGARPRLGMFLAAGALADILLYCRHKIYPLGMPNWVAHLLTVVLGMVSVLTNSTARWLPPAPRESAVMVDKRAIRGRFQVLMVSTLAALVLTGRVKPPRDGMLGLVAVERRRVTAIRAVIAALLKRMGHSAIPGVHFEAGETIALDQPAAIMDGETFTAAPGRAIVLKPTPGVCFVDLAARLPARTPAHEPPPLATPQLATGSPLWNWRARS